jgi:hypothetical protein
MTRKDFVKEDGSEHGGMGRLSESLASEWTRLRKELYAKIGDKEASGKHKAEDLKELNFCKTGMLLSSVALNCAPQNYDGVLLTVTSFQRYCLETLACYEYLTYWRDLPANDTDDPRPVAHVMGTFTVEVKTAIRFFDQGVPVWLVRTPRDFPLTTVILNVIEPTLDDEIELEFLPSSVSLWSGNTGSFRNRVCQSLRMANINLGHAAYQAQPGPFLPVMNQS